MYCNICRESEDNFGNDAVIEERFLPGNVHSVLCSKCLNKLLYDISDTQEYIEYSSNSAYVEIISSMSKTKDATKEETIQYRELKGSIREEYRNIFALERKLMKVVMDYLASHSTSDEVEL